MFICFYFILRFFSYSFKDLKDFVIKGIRFAVCSLTTGFLSFFILFEGVSSFSGSTYGKKDALFPSFYWFNSFLYLIKKQSIFAETAPVSWNEGNANMYFGILPLILIFTFIFSQRIHISEKTRTLFPFIILYISLNNSVLNYLFNGMHYQSGVPNRFAFLLPLTVSILSYDSLRVLSRESLLCKIISTIFAFTIIFLSQLPTMLDREQILSSVTTLAIILLYGLILLFFAKRKSTKNIQRNRLLSFTLLTVLCLEMTANAYYQINQNRSNPGGITYERASISMLNEKFNFNNTLDKVAVISPINDNYAYVTPAFTMQLFAGGSITSYQVNAAKFAGLYVQPNALFAQSTMTLLGSAISGTRYLVADKHSPMNHCADFIYLNPIAQTDNSIIFENDNVFPFGYYVPSSLMTELSTHTEPISDSAFWNALSLSYTKKTVVNKYNLPIIESTQESDHSSVAPPYCIITPIDKFSDTIQLGFITESEGDVYISHDYFQYLGRMPENAEVNLSTIRTTESETYEAEDFSYYVFHPDVINQLCSKVREHDFTVTTFDNNSVKGHIDMPEDGNVCLNIPYDSKWNVFVDGTKVEASPFAESYLSFPATVGNHEILIVYDLSFWTWSMTLTLISWIVFIGACIISDCRADTKVQSSTD